MTTRAESSLCWLCLGSLDPQLSKWLFDKHTRCIRKACLVLVLEESFIFHNAQISHLLRMSASVHPSWTTMLATVELQSWFILMQKTMTLSILSTGVPSLLALWEAGANCCGSCSFFWGAEASVFSLAWFWRVLSLQSLWTTGNIRIKSSLWEPSWPFLKLLGNQKVINRSGCHDENMF